MKDLLHYFYISGLIAKKIHSKLTANENKCIDEWLLESEENVVLFNKLIARQTKVEREKLSHEFNKDKAWKSVRKRIIKTSYQLKWIKYAATIILPIIIFLSIHLFKQETKTTISSFHKIMPGEFKAEISFNDGSVFYVDNNIKDSVIDHEGFQIIRNEGLLKLKNEESFEDLIYGQISVPRGGEFKIELDDGTLVYLNSETILTYPIKFFNNERRVQLKGEAYFEVVEDKSRPFIVETKEIDIEVLGTVFSVNSYDETYSATLVEGSVKLKLKNDTSLILFPGEKGKLDLNGNLIKQEVDVFSETSWTKGDFIFRKKKLEEIMYTFSRWYDIEVVFLDEWSKDISFTGSMSRYDEIDIFIQQIEATGSVNVLIEDNALIIKSNKK